MTIFGSFKNNLTADKLSSRRPEALTDAQCDHEIQLIDHASPERVASQAPSTQDGTLTPTASSSPTPPRKKKKSLLKEVAHRSLAKTKNSTHRGIHAGSQNLNGTTSNISAHSKTPLITTIEPIETPNQEPDAPRNSLASDAQNGENRGRTKTRSYGATKLHKKEIDNVSVSHIDILYENQRGCFICGMPFFSRAALGSLDPAPWTNEFHKPSPTDTSNAQVPDPSWTWSWKEWKINHDDGDDPDGFVYSFMFSKMFSWHGPSWWNSFVRRRAWIRERVKQREKRHVQESHMLNADYFTIHPQRNASRGSRGTSRSRGAYSVTALAKQEMEQEIEKEDITNIAQLMEVLKLCRIDREKMEAVENFTVHGGDDLYYLREKMHDIMALFIFQVSRRILLAHLLQMSDEAIEHRKKHQEQGTPENEEEKRRIDNLQAAIKHAEEEVQRLEFWSDVKEMVERGESLGAVDDGKNWGHGWEGLDNSAPKDVISMRKRNLMKEDTSSKASEASGLEQFMTPPERPASTTSPSEKGKGKAAD